ncbi:MAG: hypothetical protein AAF771_01705 [Pseudomonadota bacterium]
MKLVLAGVLAAGLAVTPAAAEEGEMREGLDLLGEGTRLLLEGLMAEMEPALKGFADTLRGIEGYHAPEVLPNGDIIIRRKRDGEATPEAPLPETEEVEI